jgi:ribonuclease HII
MAPTFTVERKAIRRGQIVCGIDEAGRGPWAGPVVAAAVILDPGNIPRGLDDSKKLTADRRDALFGPVMMSAHVGIGIVDAPRIDAINILQATFEAMQLAVATLGTSPTLALIDGNRAPSLSCDVTLIIGGDATSLSIAAASVVAKVTRDRIMVRAHDGYPQYGFAAHKGYGTAAHAAALSVHGPCALHRMSFSPIRSMALNRR